ncbi:MAG: NusG domain II-containing protein [Ruminococcus sp.]|nr:NusG domain II-containing protein [Ruminococcus sp.]
MKNRERKYFSVYDIFIILIAVAASVLALLSQINADSDALNCVIRVKGEIIECVELSTVNESLLIEVDGEFPVSVYITDYSVRVESASCPDKLCEHSGEITRSGQSIVCLPAKVSITLESTKNEFDAVVG